MYKLLCSNLTKSHRSLSNFTGYYRKVAQKCNKCNVTSKYNSQSELQNNQSIEDVEVEEPLEADPSPDNPNSYTSFCGRKIKKPKDEPPIAELSGVRSNHKKIDSISRRAFKNREAELYYQSAVDQCTRIKKKLERYQQLATLSRPPRLVSDIKKALNITEPDPQKIKPPKRKVIKRRDIKNETVISELNKIDDIKTAKPSSQFKETKIKITYPTHKLRYKMGTQGYKLEHKVVTKSVTKPVYKDVVFEHIQSMKSQHSKTSEKEKATVKELRTSNQQKKIPIIAELLNQKYFEENSERDKQQKKFENAVIQLHPSLKKASVLSKMAFKHTYNKLLKKSGFTYQRPSKSKGTKKADNKENTAALVEEEQLEKESTVSFPLPASTTNSKEVFLKDPKPETKTSREAVMEHPLSSGKQTPLETSTKRPKRVLSDKSENFDVDAVCIKANTNSSINTYGDYVAESEQNVKKFVEAHKKENQNETKAESEIGEIKKKVIDNETAESIGKYLLKLKELRDRTALGEPHVKKMELDNQPGKAQKMEDQKIEDAASKFKEKAEKTALTDECHGTTDKEIETRTKTDGLIGRKTENKENTGNNKEGKYYVLDRHNDKYRVRVAKSTESRGDFARSQSAVSLKPDKSLVMKSFPLKSIKSENADKKVRKKRASVEPTSGEDTSQQLIEKIMNTYRVQTKFKVSTAEMKRIDRKKKREREKQLRVEVKMQQKKLDEALIGEQVVRKDKYKLENFESTSQKFKNKTDLGGDGGSILKETQNVEKKKNPVAKQTIGDSLERKEEPNSNDKPASKLETDRNRTKAEISVKDMKQYAETLLNEQSARDTFIENMEMEHAKMLEDTKMLKEILEQFVVKEREKKYKYISNPQEKALPDEKEKVIEGRSSVRLEEKKNISLERDIDNKDMVHSSKLLDKKVESQTRDGPGQEHTNELQAKEKINNYIEDDVKTIDKLFTRIPKANLEKEILKRAPKIEQRVGGKVLKEKEELIKKNIEKPDVNMLDGKNVFKESFEKKVKPSEKGVEEGKVLKEKEELIKKNIGKSSMNILDGKNVFKESFEKKAKNSEKGVEEGKVPKEKEGLIKKNTEKSSMNMLNGKSTFKESFEKKAKPSEKGVEEVKQQTQNKIIPEETNAELTKKQKKLPVFGVSKFKKPANHEVNKKLDDRKNLANETVTSNKFNRAQRENLTKLRNASNKLVKPVKKGDVNSTDNDRGKSTFPRNAPTIRREKPPPIKDKRKKESPKTKKDIVLPPKHHNYPPKQYTKGKTKVFAGFKDASRKTDKIMPRRAQVNPNITPRDKIFMEPQKADVKQMITKVAEPIGDIVKDLKHVTAEKEEPKKTKSLAVLPNVRKEKILEKLDMSWEPERNKMEQMKESFENMSKDRLKENRDIDKDLRIGIINSRRYAKDYLQTKNETSNVKTSPHSHVMRDNALVKDTKETNDRPRLIISLRYRPFSANEIANANIKTLPPSLQVDDSSLKRVSSADSKRPVYKESPSLQPLNVDRTEATLTKSKSININTDELSSQSKSLKTTEDALFVKWKRCRIEDDMSKKTAVKDDLNTKTLTDVSDNAFKRIKTPQFLQFTPKDVLWHTQRDLDLCFSGLKRGRIEDDHVKMYAKGVGNKNNKEKDGTHVVHNAIEMQQAADKPKQEIVEENKVKSKTFSNDAKALPKETSNKKIERKTGAQKLGLTFEQFPVLNSEVLAREIAKKLEEKVQSIKAKAELIRKAIKPASEAEINKKLITAKTSSPIRITKTAELDKKSASEKRSASCLITRMQGNPSTSMRLNKSGRKYNRRSNRPRSTDTKKIIEKDPNSDHNVKKMLNAMKEADKELENVLKCYEICKIPQSTTKKHNTSKITRRIDAKVLDQAFKKTVDSKTFIIDATERFSPRMRSVKENDKAKSAMKLDSTKKKPPTASSNKKNASAGKSETSSTNTLADTLTKSKNREDVKARKENEKKPTGPANPSKPTTKGSETLSLVYIKEADKQLDRTETCSTITDSLSTVQFDMSREVSKDNFINNLLLREPSIKDLIVNKVTTKWNDNKEMPANKVVVSSHSTVTCSNGSDQKPTADDGCGEDSHKISENKLFIQMEGGKDTSGTKIVVMSSNGKTEECEKDASKKTEDKLKNSPDIPGKRTTIVRVSNDPEMQVSMLTDYPHHTSTLQNIEKTQHASIAENDKEIRKKWTIKAKKQQSDAKKRNREKSKSTELPLQKEKRRTRKCHCVIPSMLKKPVVKKQKLETYELKEKPKCVTPNSFNKRAGIKIDRVGFPKTKQYISVSKSRKKMENSLLQFYKDLPFMNNDNIETLLMTSLVDNKLEELKATQSRNTFGCQTSEIIVPVKTHKSRSASALRHLNLEKKARQTIYQMRMLLQRQLDVLRAVTLSTLLTYAMAERKVPTELMHFERAVCSSDIAFLNKSCNKLMKTSNYPLQLKKLVTEEKTRNKGKCGQFTNNNTTNEKQIDSEFESNEKQGQEAREAALIGLHCNYKLGNPEAYEKVGEVLSVVKVDKLTLAENSETDESKSISKRKSMEGELAESKNLLSSRKNQKWKNFVRGNDEKEELNRGVKRTDRNFDSKSLTGLFKEERPTHFHTNLENSRCKEECKQHKIYDRLTQQTSACEFSETNNFCSYTTQEETDTFPSDKYQHNYMQSSAAPTSLASIEHHNNLLKDYNIKTYTEPCLTNSKSNVSNKTTTKKSYIYKHTTQKIKRLLIKYNKNNSEAVGPPDGLKWKKKTNIKKQYFSTKKYTALMARLSPISNTKSKSRKTKKTDNIINQNKIKLDITDVEFTCSNQCNKPQTWVPEIMGVEENQRKIFAMYLSSKDNYKGGYSKKKINERDTTFAGDEQKVLSAISQTEINEFIPLNLHKPKGLLNLLASTINNESSLSGSIVNFDDTENQKEISLQPGDTKDFSKHRQTSQTTENQTGSIDMIQCPISGIWTEKTDYKTKSTLISSPNEDNKGIRTPWNIENKKGADVSLTVDHRKLLDLSRNSKIDDFPKHEALHDTDLFVPKNEGGTRNSIQNPHDKTINLLTSSQYLEGSNNNPNEGRQFLVSSQNADIEDFFRQSISPHVTKNQRKVFDTYFTKIESTSRNLPLKMRSHKNTSQLPIYLQNEDTQDLSKHTVTLQTMKNKIRTLLKSALSTDNQPSSRLSVQSPNESVENVSTQKLTDKYNKHNENGDIEGLPKLSSELCIPRNDGGVSKISILQTKNRELSVQTENEDVEIIFQSKISENEAFLGYCTDNQNKGSQILFPEHDVILTANIENKEKSSEMLVTPQNETNAEKLFKQIITMQAIENNTDHSDFIIPTIDRTFKSENESKSKQIIENGNQKKNSKIMVSSHDEDHDALAKNRAALPATQNEGGISRNLRNHNQINQLQISSHNEDTGCFSRHKLTLQEVETEGTILRNLIMNIDRQLLISSYNENNDALAKQSPSSQNTENTVGISGSLMTSRYNQSQRSRFLVGSHDEDAEALIKCRPTRQMVESGANIIRHPIINNENQNQRSQLLNSSHNEDIEAHSKRRLTPQELKCVSDGFFQESENSTLGNNKSKSKHFLVPLQGSTEDVSKRNLIPQRMEYKRSGSDLFMSNTKRDLAHKTDRKSESKPVLEEHSKPKRCVLNRDSKMYERLLRFAILTTVCSNNTVNQPPIISRNENIEKDSSKQKQPPKNTDNERDLFIPTRKNENDLSGPEVPILPRQKETFISHNQKQLEGISQIIANRTELGEKETEQSTGNSKESKITPGTQKNAAPQDEQCNVKHPIKARIEEIFKKHSNEEDKICKFNKNLVKHIKRSEETVTKEEVVANKESTSPDAEKKKQKILEMQKFILSELKKKGHEGKSVHENKDEQKLLPEEARKDQQKEPLQKNPIYIEKDLPNRYADEKGSQTLLKPVTSICERVCLPLKKLSEVALKPPVEEATTLNKFCEQKIHCAPKIERRTSEKYKGLKIMYMKIKRKAADENFVPMMLSMKNSKEPTLGKSDDPESVKRQILEFRYELLRKLHQEFSSLYAEDFRENLGKFERVARFYESVTRDMSQNETDVVHVGGSKSMEELLGPCSRPSFGRVARFYNLILQKNKKRSNSQEKEPTQLINKLPNDVDKDRNKVKGSDMSSKCEKEKTNRKYPDDSGGQS